MRDRYHVSIELFLWLFCIVLFAPLIIVIINSLKSFGQVVMNPLALPSPVSWQNYIDTWNLSSYPKVFLNSIIVSGLSTAIVVIISSMAGYKLARVNNQFSRILMIVFLIGLMIPFPVIMIPIAQIAHSFGITNNLVAVSILNAGYACSFGILMYTQAMKSVPYEIEECAMIDGSSGYNLFFKIIFPMLKPITGTVIIFYIIRFWNDLLLPLVLINKPSNYTIPLSQMTFFNQFSIDQWNLLLASGVMSVLPVLILFIFTQKSLIGGIMEGAVKG